ncbi:hypothetical protein Baya_1026 [Bagarius yarrelli]|uniref:Disks large homologue 1 N-terminal PEST domain-containing protein n=1 Tax=Bagarius yarrelli TaxID=175774 RepID=A0A556TJX6_BAGYA|nr:hypothetical protein Baya_1026 [Bagarius yarrelli]
MSVHLAGQQSRCLEIHTTGGDSPCECGYPVSPAPAVPTMPRQRARLTASRSDGSWRSPSRNMMLRTKGGSCDLCWSECGCAQHGWRESYQASPAPIIVNTDTLESVPYIVEGFEIAHHITLSLGIFRERAGDDKHQHLGDCGGGVPDPRVSDITRGSEATFQTAEGYLKQAAAYLQAAGLPGRSG